MKAAPRLCLYTNAMEKTPFSYHIFLFPFRWDFLKPYQVPAEVSFEQRTDLNRITAFMKDMEDRWKPSDFQIRQDHHDRYPTYNEFAYFHEYTRDVLGIDLNERDTARRYQYILPPDQPCHFEITTAAHAKKNKETPEYRLNIQSIVLTWHDIGTGFLAYYLENDQTGEPLDILRINDLGRRLYPQFLGYVDPEPETPPATEQKKPAATDAPKGSFLADTIRLTGLGKKIEENFSYFDNQESLNGDPTHLPAHFTLLLDNRFATVTRATAQQKGHDWVYIRPLIDDRMFVLSYFLHSGKMDKARDLNKKKEQYAYVDDPFWYAYLFVDTSENITCKSLPMQRRLAARHTYDRWIGNTNWKQEPEGHLFGVSRYSFVVLADEGSFNRGVIVNHFRYLYFQMAALALMQRAAILRFSEETARVVSRFGGMRSPRKKTREIREMYEAYLGFINKIYFREITPQEQGIELYDLMRDTLEIDADAKALQIEIEELHRYAQLLEAERNGHLMNQLTWIGTIFLPFSIVGAVFGFSNYTEASFTWTIWIWLGISVLVVLMIVFGLNFSKLKK